LCAMAGCRSKPGQQTYPILGNRFISSRARAINPAVTGRLDPIYDDPHSGKSRLFLHYGDLSDASTAPNIFSPGIAGSSFDTALGIYTGTCGSFAQVACDDDSGPGL